MLGPDHPDVGTSPDNYARLLIDRRDYTAAEPMMCRAVAIQVAQRSADACEFAFYDAKLGIALAGMGDAAEARAEFEWGLAVANPQHHRNRAPDHGRACRSCLRRRRCRAQAQAHRGAAADHGVGLFRRPVAERLARCT